MRKEKTGRVRIVDIAREAGVSVTAANKVLSGGSSNIRVGREKAELIRSIAERLDYRPNIIARTLVGGKSKIIGVHIDSLAPLTYFKILAGIEHELSALGYRTMIAESHDNIESISEAYHIFTQYGADGVILMSHNYPKQNDQIRKHLTHLKNTVYIGEPCAEHVAYVYVDFASGIESAVEHLLERRKKRIGIVVVDPAINTIELRLKGFHRAVEQAGKRLEYAGVHVLSSLDMITAAPGIYEDFVVPNKTDALILTNDILAAHVLRHFAKRGVRVPEDIAVVGHDNMEFSSGLLPSLTTMDENSGLIARHAVELLMLQLSGNLNEADRVRTVVPTLIPREST